VILPPRPSDLLDVLDAVVLAGGADIDPGLYGRPGAPADGVDRDRDRVETDLVRSAHCRGMPVLGVCRGAQILAVTYAGTLVSDLGEDKPHVIVQGFHPIEAQSGSILSSILGETALVNSLHHQALDSPGPSWRVTAGRATSRRGCGVGRRRRLAGPRGPVAS